MGKGVGFFSFYVGTKAQDLAFRHASAPNGLSPVSTCDMYIRGGAGKKRERRGRDRDPTLIVGDPPRGGVTSDQRVSAQGHTACGSAATKGGIMGEAAGSLPAKSSSHQ